MALQISRTPEGYVRVKETLMSFTDTKVSIILYDLENNRKKIDQEDWRPLDKGGRDWVIKYYLKD